MLMLLGEYLCCGAEDYKFGQGELTTLFNKPSLRARPFASSSPVPIPAEAGAASLEGWDYKFDNPVDADFCVEGDLPCVAAVLSVTMVWPAASDGGEGGDFEEEADEGEGGAGDLSLIADVAKVSARGGYGMCD